MHKKILDILIATLNSFGSILSVFAALIFVLFFISYQRTEIDFFDYSPFPITIKSTDTTNALKLTLIDNTKIESNSLTMRDTIKTETKNLKYNLVNLFSWCIMLCYAIFMSKMLKLLMIDIKHGGNDNIKYAKRLKKLAMLTFGLFTYNLLLIIFLKFYLIQVITIGDISYHISLRGINYTILVLAHVFLFTGYFIKIHNSIRKESPTV